MGFEDRENAYADFKFRHLVVERKFIRETGQHVYHLSAIATAPKIGACLLQDIWQTAGEWNERA